MKINNITYKKDLIFSETSLYKESKFCAIRIKNSDKEINKMSSLSYCGSDDFIDETFYKNIIIPMSGDHETLFLDLENAFMLISVVDFNIDKELINTIILDQKSNIHTYDNLRVTLSAREKINIITEIQKYIT